MKILHLVPTYFPAYRYGGPIKSVHEFNKWLVKKGLDVTVYTTNLDGKNLLDVPLGREVIRDGVKIYYFPITFRGWEYSRELHKNLAKNIRLFDLVHITSVFLSASTLGAYYSKKFKKPYIISPRGSLMTATLKKKAIKKKIYLSLLEKRNLAGARAIHFTSEEEKNEYTDANLPLRSAIVIPNGFDPAELEHKVSPGFFRKKFKIDSSKKIILFLSRISWKKGLDTLIPAFAMVKKENLNIVLVIAGGDDEDYKRKVEQLIKKYNLEEDVVFTGMITGEDRVAAYKESYLFVLPSYAENFGGAVMESLYLEKPVVITNAVGTAAIVERANAGLVVRKNEAEVANAISKILGDEKLARDMGARGGQLVREKYNWSQIGNQFIDGYNRILKI